MPLTDNVHAAARTLAQLTHMNQTAAMNVLDLIVYMDDRAMQSIPEHERTTLGSAPALLNAMCAMDLAQGSRVCEAWERVKAEMQGD